MVIGAFNRTIPDYDRLVAEIEAKPGVTVATAFIEGQVMASANQRHSGALVRGMKRADIEKRDFMRNALVQGTLEGFDDGSGILVGVRMARKFGLYTGDKS